jgi:hypothetical protein
MEFAHSYCNFLPVNLLPLTTSLDIVYQNVLSMPDDTGPVNKTFPTYSMSIFMKCLLNTYKTDSQGPIGIFRTNFYVLTRIIHLFNTPDTVKIPDVLMKVAIKF